jgi:hypothetical protein
MTDALARPSDADDAPPPSPPPPSTPEPSLCLSKRALSAVPLLTDVASAASFGAAFRPETLRHLDLSRNRLASLAPESSMVALIALEVLDVSRNQLRELPSWISRLTSLREVHAASNSMRPVARSLPVAALARLPHLTILDLRYNQKLRPAAPGVPALLAALPSCEVRVTAERKGEGALAGRCEPARARDPTLLRSQLAPLSTPQLRARLEGAFGVPTDPATVGREEVLDRLVRAHAREGPRAVRVVSGKPVSDAVCDALLECLRTTRWPVGPARERPKVDADGYFTLQRPSREGDRRFRVEGGQKQRRAAAKLRAHAELWRLAEVAMREVDPEHWDAMTAVAFTRGFRGSPHIDTENVGCFYGLSLGDYGPVGQGGADDDDDDAEGLSRDEGGGRVGSRGVSGAVAVESGTREVTHVDTRRKMARVEGRNPHWVTPYAGERYSLIYYRTEGEPEPHETFLT